MPTEEVFDTREFDYPLGYKETMSEDTLGMLDSLSHKYIKGVVKDVISNPIKWMATADKKGVTNKEKFSFLFGKVNEETTTGEKHLVNDSIFFDVMPANSLLCYVPEGKGSKNMSHKTIIAFPFFPSHLSLPVKPGEHIWLIKETKMISSGYSFYYWMCRVSTYRQVDDINYTFLPQHKRVFSALKNQKKDQTKSVSEDDNLMVTSYVENHEKQLPDNVSNSSIIASSNAYKSEFTMEPVPRKFKDCGDLLLQGSNNSHLQFTTEKFRDFSEDYLNNDKKQNTYIDIENKSDISDFRRPAAGALDMAVGRDKKNIQKFINTMVGGSETSPGVVIGKRDIGYQKFEAAMLDKINESENEDEDLPRNAYSRLYMSMDGAIDKVFEVKEQEAFKYKDGASLVAYSNHVRIYSEETIRLANINNETESKFGMIEISESGQITLQAGKSDVGAKIILQPDGNIFLKPGPKGLLHLGGDESDTFLSVCGVPTSIDAENGTATPESIKTSLGGELFRNANPDLESTISFKETVAAVAAAVIGGTPPGEAPDVPDVSSADGTASSKVVIKA